jgi:hypothetical protein
MKRLPARVSEILIYRRGVARAEKPILGRELLRKQGCESAEAGRVDLRHSGD